MFTVGFVFNEPNFCFFYFEKVSFLFPVRFFSISRVKWGSIEQSGARGDRWRNDRPSSISISWLLVREKGKEKRNVDDVTHWVLSFWLNLRLGSFFASSSSCTFFSFPLLLFSLVHLAGVSSGARGCLFGG